LSHVTKQKQTNIYIYIYMELVNDKSSFKPGGLRENHVGIKAVVYIVIAIKMVNCAEKS
jgi:hypothetical protein